MQPAGLCFREAGRSRRNLASVAFGGEAERCYKRPTVTAVLNQRAQRLFRVLQALARAQDRQAIAHDHPAVLVTCRFACRGQIHPLVLELHYGPLGWIFWRRAVTPQRVVGQPGNAVI